MPKILLGVLLCVFLACLSPVSAAVNGIGATFPYPVYTAWSFEYQKQTGNQVNYSSAGSGEGIRLIKGRVTDFAGSDYPLEENELAEFRLFQFPAIIGGVVLAVNIDGVEKNSLKLTPELIAGIFSGKITRWNNREIAELNKDLTLPDAEIKTVYRSDKSGTTAIFTGFLSVNVPEWKEKFGSTADMSRLSGKSAKGNEGVARAVKQEKNSIGYVGYAYTVIHNLSWVKIQNSGGYFPEPSASSFSEAAKYAVSDESGKLSFTAKTAEAWPIIGASYILIAQEDKTKGKLTADFFKWAFEHGDELASKLTYITLPENLKQNIIKFWLEKGLIEK
jgi:phosphate transport system substrate-binding protein